MKKSFWLITTEHLKERLWFPEEADYVVAMNYVAILAAEEKVGVIAFILMSNHVHFVLYGTYEQVLEFINRFKKRYAQYFSRKYPAKKPLRLNRVDIREVLPQDESFERAVAYVQMNCVGANICLTPNNYPWGTGNCFFNRVPPSGRSISSLNKSRQQSILHSRVPLPSNYLLNGQGYIEPSSYVLVQMVESIFRTPRRMDYFLRSSSKAQTKDASPSFKDQLVLSAAKDLCISLFKKPDFQALKESEQAELLRQLRYRFSADPNQLSRVTNISYDNVCKLLESFPTL